MKHFLRLAITSFLFFASALVAQNSAPPSSAQSAARQEPCWRQAGISQSAMQQRHEIERDTHSQIAAVCANSSLTTQQKQQQVKEIHDQAQEKVNALITPEQQNTLHACQQQRSGNRSNNEGHTGGAGPCGNFAASQSRQGAENGSTGGNPQPPQN
jgi:Spy/CpxP family protein refolding chaperone